MWMPTPHWRLGKTQERHICGTSRSMDARRSDALIFAEQDGTRRRRLAKRVPWRWHHPFSDASGRYSILAYSTLLANPVIARTEDVQIRVSSNADPALTGTPAFGLR